MLVSRLLLVVVAAVIAGACGNDGKEEPLVAGPGNDVRYEGSFTVLESPAHGPELCSNVATSLPPQCGGVPITNWDWDAVDGEESINGTTWGSWHVVGTYADGALTLTEPPGPPRTSERERPDFSRACEAPDIVDPEAGEEAWWAATADPLLPPIGGLVSMWVSGSGTTAEPFVVNVLVRPGARDGAMATIRERFAGRLCVVERDLPTEAELRKVQDEVIDEAAKAVLGQVQTAYADPQRGAVVARVWIVDDDAERYVRDRWGDRVILEPLLTPVASD